MRIITGIASPNRIDLEGEHRQQHHPHRVLRAEGHREPRPGQEAVVGVDALVVVGRSSSSSSQSSSGSSRRGRGGLGGVGDQQGAGLADQHDRAGDDDARACRRPRPRRAPTATSRASSSRGATVTRSGPKTSAASSPSCSAGMPAAGRGDLGDDDLVHHLLEHLEQAARVLVGHHADHADQRVEGEGLGERGGGRPGAVRVVRGVQDDGRAAPDHLQPAGEDAPARSPRGRRRG